MVKQYTRDDLIEMDKKGFSLVHSENEEKTLKWAEQLKSREAIPGFAINRENKKIYFVAFKEKPAGRGRPFKLEGNPKIFHSNPDRYKDEKPVEIKPTEKIESDKETKHRGRPKKENIQESTKRRGRPKKEV